MKAVDGKLAPDGTHLNRRGYVMFARVVVDELRDAVPALAPVLRSEPLDPSPEPGEAKADESGGHAERHENDLRPDDRRRPMPEEFRGGRTLRESGADPRPSGSQLNHR